MLSFWGPVVAEDTGGTCPLGTKKHELHDGHSWCKATQNLKFYTLLYHQYMYPVHAYALPARLQTNLRQSYRHRPMPEHT